jgi:hypothetical protein
MVINELKNENIDYAILSINKNNISSIKCHSKFNIIKTDIIEYKDTYYYIIKI